MAEENVNYTFVKGDPSVSPLLLLHGQGGDENDLLPIGKYLSPNSPMLSIRGRVQEQGMNRYFKHSENGGFDLNNLEQETTWLFKVLNELCQKFNIDYERFIVVGYSNGANVVARALLTRSDTFHTGIFFHPMALSTVDSKQDLSDVKVWMSHGDQDPIVLDTYLEEQGAEVTIFRHDQSHNLNEAELANAKSWLANSGRLQDWQRR